LYSQSLQQSWQSVSRKSPLCPSHYNKAKKRKKKKERDVAYISEEPIRKLAHPMHAPYCIYSFFPVSFIFPCAIPAAAGGLQPCAVFRDALM